jgi:aminoglycoside phosphotransferase (APT) family kinase protein
MLVGSPEAEVLIDEPLIRKLLGDQYEEAADLPLTFVEEGYDNATWRLGADLAVRIPRREIAARFITSEQHWLGILAPDLPLPVPVPIHVGTPTSYYPWPWSVVPWFEGDPVDLAPLDASAAASLCAFMTALHKPAPPEAPFNEFRSVPLSVREPFLLPRLERLKSSSDLITPGLEDLWQAAVAAPVDIDPTWIHGDLHARNVLSSGGAIAAVIDWGDMASGDKATDLASIWALLAEPAARAEAIAALGPLSEATLLRAKGWAISFGVLLLDSGLVDTPRHAEMGRQTLACILTDL